MAKFSINNPCMIILCLFLYLARAICSNDDTDLRALFAFKKSIVNDPTGVLDSWNETTHFCSWKGILCSKRHQNRVVSLNLMSQGLVGSLSPHLGNLSFLRSIILQNNSFRGSIPEEIGRLRRLEWIEFSNNSLGGEIPRNISQCKNIYYLNLIDNNLTGIIVPEISSLVKLEALGLTGNGLSGTIPSFIGNLSSLVLLSLANNGLHGEIPESFVQLQRLQLLSLDGNFLSGEIPYGIYNISGFDLFSMRSNRLHGTVPSDIGFRFPRLRILDLGDNRFTGALPFSLSNSSLIQRINLSSNNFTGKITIDFSKLTDLEYFIASSNHLEGDIGFVSSMINCTNLESLSVFDNLLTGSLPISIANLSSHFTFLSIAGNQLHGNIPSAIVDVRSLNRLNIEYNNLEGPMPFNIGKMHKLQEIYLGGNRLTSELPFSLGNLTLLNHLSLGKNNFLGTIPQSLGNCSNLLRLDLSYNNFNGSIPPEITSLSSISISFDLAHNALMGSIPSEVGSLRNLVNLDLSYNRLSGLIPSSLSSCVMLQRLRLESNFLDGEIPDTLSTLRGLQELDLSRNNLSGNIPSFLSEILLVNLNLSFNSFRGEVPILGVFRNESAVSIEGNIGLCGGIPQINLPPCPSTSRNSKKKKISTLWKILIPAFGAICLIVSASLFCMIIISRRRKETQVSMPFFESEFLRLSYGDLLKATDGFSEANLLGAGRFGTVYKGILDDEPRLVAVKVLNLDIRGAARSFISECNALRGIRHRNLVKILSICPSTDFHGDDFKALVYELMENGSLEKWMHHSSDEDQESRNLSTIQRLNIAIDVACAVEYLHCGTDSSIVHGDLKPSNILLDENMTAHLGDFGLAKAVYNTVSSSTNGSISSSSVGIRGTIGYIPPEYGMSSIVSTAGDVHSYGVFLLEMFTNTRPTDDMYSSITIHDFVKRALPNNVMEVVDPFIIDEHKKLNFDSSSRIKNCMISVLGIGVVCSEEFPACRMLMPRVVTELHKIKNAYIGQ